MASQEQAPAQEAKTQRLKHQHTEERLDPGFRRDDELQKISQPVGWIEPRKRRMTPGFLPFGPSGPASPFAPLLRRSRRCAP